MTYTYEQLFDKWLDDTYGEVIIEGVTFYASEILKTLDPIAYKTLFYDWVDMYKFGDVSLKDIVNEKDLKNENTT